MQWLNLEVTLCDRPEFVGCEPAEQGTWLKLAFYCAKLENAGVIQNCGQWKNRKWEQLVRVTKREIATSTELWSYDGTDLVVHFYPKEQELKAKRLRDMAGRAGRASGEARRRR